MFKSTITAFSLITLTIFSAANNFNKDLPTPVQVQEDIIRTKARFALQELNAPPDRINRLVNAVHAGHIASNGIDPILIATIFRPESDYKINAVSKKGYKSLMGTPKAVMKWEYAETNVVYGSQILRDKITEAHGNIDEAMVHYKGYGGKESKEIAAKQMKLYREVKTKVEQRILEGEKRG